ncbi:hypothetical protein DPMN_188794 [Dreissena polymorpha]|uniref:Uncharacterized protein n=1 Tax=Dreissena polymorpha TaxID=45954 RepID=A0A9D4IBN8_DREPO|nr:hypothetical protein DPMN_188794 [Dreissena polymorpha]
MSGRKGLYRTTLTACAYGPVYPDRDHYILYVNFVGEDRWLCTLLLQQGYRVEYCAASDALTYAPEGKLVSAYFCGDTQRGTN